MLDNAIDLPEPEEAQAVFADLYDGDYLMSDLMARSPEMMLALMSLHHAMWFPSPAPRATTFRSETGKATEITRPAKKPLRFDSIQADQMQVRVRNGRVEGFTKT